MFTIDSSTKVISSGLMVNQPFNYSGLQNSEYAAYGIDLCRKKTPLIAASGLGVSGVSACHGLPFGLSLNSSNGIISGEPRVTGNYYAEVSILKPDNSSDNNTLIKKIRQISFTKNLTDFTVNAASSSNFTSSSINIFLRNDGKFNVTANFESCSDFDLNLSDRSPSALFQYMQPFIVRGCLDADDAEIIIGLLQESNVQDFIVFQSGYGLKTFERDLRLYNGAGALSDTSIIYSGSPGVICLKKSGEVKSIGFKGSSPVINAVKNIPNNAKTGVKKIEAFGWTIMAIKDNGVLVPWGGYYFDSGVTSRAGGHTFICEDPRPPYCGIWMPGYPVGWPWGKPPCRCPQDKIKRVEIPSSPNSTWAEYKYDRHGIITDMPSNLQDVTSIHLTEYAAICVSNGNILAWGELYALSSSSDWSRFVKEAGTASSSSDSFIQLSSLKTYKKVVEIKGVGYAAITVDGKIVTGNPILKQWAAVLDDRNIQALDIKEDGIILLNNGCSIVWFNPYDCFMESMKAVEEVLPIPGNLSLPLINENGALLFPFKVTELSTINGKPYMLSEGGLPNFYFCGDKPSWMFKQKVLFKISKGFTDINPAVPFVERSENVIIVNASERFKFTLKEVADELDIYNDFTLVDYPNWTINGPSWMSINTINNKTYITGTPPNSLVGSSVSFDLTANGIRDGVTIWSKTHQLSLSVIASKPVFNLPSGKNKFSFLVAHGDPVSNTISIINPLDTTSVKPATVLPQGLSFTYDTTSGVGAFSGTPKLSLGTTSIRLKAEGPGGSSSVVVAFEITYGNPVIVPQQVQVMDKRPMFIYLNRFVTNSGNTVAVKDWFCEDKDLFDAGLSLDRKKGIISGVIDSSKVSSSQSGTIDLDIKATAYAGDITDFTVSISITAPPPMWQLSDSITVNTTAGEYFEQPISIPSSSDPSSIFVLDLPTGLIFDFEGQKIKGIPEVEGTFVCPVSSTYRVIDVAMSTTGLSAVLLYDNTVVTWHAYTGEYIATPEEAIGVVSIAAGSKGVIALKKDGSVISWGYSGFLEIPQAVYSGVIGVSAYNNTFAALKDNGSIVFWNSGDSSNPSIISPPLVGKRTGVSVAKYYIIALNSEGIEAFPLRGSLCIDSRLSVQKPFVVQTDQNSGFSSVSVGSEIMFALRDSGRCEMFLLGIPRYDCIPDCCFITNYILQNEVFGSFTAAAIAAVGKTVFMITEQNKLIVQGDPSLYPKDLSMPTRFSKIVGTNDEMCAYSGCPKSRGSIGIILGENGSLQGIGPVVIPSFLFSDSSNSIIFNIAPKPPDNRLANNGKWMSANASGNSVAMLEDLSLKPDPSKSKKVSFFSFDADEMKWNKDGFFENGDTALIFNSSVSISEDGKKIIIGGGRNNN
jgi:hypothetical protein